MSETGFLLAKRNVMQKVELLWAEFMERMQVYVPVVSEIEERMQFSFAAPKISKGENYLGLPYIVLDGPRHFHDEDIFTYRSLFWWGNFFSFTLLLQGEMWNAIKEKCDFRLLPSDTYVSLADTPWVHHYDEETVMLLSDILEKEREDDIRTHPFLKLSRRLEIDTDEEMVLDIGLTTWELFSGFVVSGF